MARSPLLKVELRVYRVRVVSFGQEHALVLVMTFKVGAGHAKIRRRHGPNSSATSPDLV